MSAGSWLIQAALIGIVTFIATWMTSQSATNTQTAISINTLTNKLEDRNDGFKELKTRLEKMDERIRVMEIQIFGGRPPK